jgi:copper chaperone
MSRTLSIQVRGMSCEHCVQAIEQALAQNPGVEGVRVAIGTVELVFDDKSISKSQLIECIRAAGPYDVTGFSIDG